MMMSQTPDLANVDMWQLVHGRNRARPQRYNKARDRRQPEAAAQVAAAADRKAPHRNHHHHPEQQQQRGGAGGGCGLAENSEGRFMSRGSKSRNLLLDSPSAEEGSGFRDGVPGLTLADTPSWYHNATSDECEEKDEDEDEEEEGQHESEDFDKVQEDQRYATIGAARRPQQRQQQQGMVRKWISSQALGGEAAVVSTASLPGSAAIQPQAFINAAASDIVCDELEEEPAGLAATAAVHIIKGATIHRPGLLEAAAAANGSQQQPQSQDVWRCKKGSRSSVDGSPAPSAAAAGREHIAGGTALRENLTAVAAFDGRQQQQQQQRPAAPAAVQGLGKGRRRQRIYDSDEDDEEVLAQCQQQQQQQQQLIPVAKQRWRQQAAAVAAAPAAARSRPRPAALTSDAVDVVVIDDDDEVVLEDDVVIDECQAGNGDGSDDDCDSGSSHEDVCGVCGAEGELLLCEGCPLAFHLGCVGLRRVPTGDWWCQVCKDAGRAGYM
jgi:hypothetical protein